MKLDPVFVVAPQARPAMMPTRRAALLAIGSGIVGAAAGHFGTALLRSGDTDSGAATTLPADEAERYRWALEISAPSTPIGDLMAVMMPLLGVVNDEYARGNVDERLWRAVHRIAEQTLQMPRFEARQASFVLLPTLRLRTDDLRTQHYANSLERLVR